MTLVKIKRSSIKKNPNAGNRITIVPSDTRVIFSINKKLPKWLNDVSSITSQMWHSSDLVEIKAVLTDIKKLKRLGKFLEDEKAKGTKVNIEVCNYYTTLLNHLPESEYFFKYENPLVKCNECKEKIRLNNIIEECGEEYYYRKCPNCSSLNSFDIEFEKIEDLNLVF